MVAPVSKKDSDPTDERRTESGEYEVDPDRDDEDRVTIPDLGPAGWGWEGAPLHDTIPAPPAPGVVCDDVLSAVDAVLRPHSEFSDE